jgi:pyrroloquinoline quinone (PQQ) biosynthesis protein C
VAAYEVQAAEVARTKADGLRTHYGVGPAGTAFWEVHAGLEEDHAGWTVAALAAVAADPGEVARAAGASARAWWAFLDEREAAAA